MIESLLSYSEYWSLRIHDLETWHWYRFRLTIFMVDRCFLLLLLLKLLLSERVIQFPWHFVQKKKKGVVYYKRYTLRSNTLLNLYFAFSEIFIVGCVLEMILINISSTIINYDSSLKKNPKFFVQFSCHISLSLFLSLWRKRKRANARNTMANGIWSNDFLSFLEKYFLFRRFTLNFLFNGVGRCPIEINVC